MFLHRAHPPLCLLFTGLLGLLIISIQCTHPVSAQLEIERSGPLDRRSLSNQLWQSDSLLVIYGDRHQAEYEALISGMQWQFGRGRSLAVSLRKAAGLSLEEISCYPAMLIGSWSENGLIKSLQPQLPLEFDEEGLRFDGRHYSSEDLIFKLFPFPNPANPDMPVFLITGKRDEQIISLLKDQARQSMRNLFWQSWGYELYDQGQARILGYLSDSSWQVDRRIHFEFLEEADTLVKSEHFIMINRQARIGKERLEAIGAACEAHYRKILEFTGAPDPGLEIPYFLYPSSEVKGLQLRNTREAQVDFEVRQMHVVESQWFGGSDQHQEGRLLLRQLLGQPRWLPLEIGLSTALNENWRARGCRHWANKLHHAGFLPDAAELASEEWWENASELIRSISAAAFVEFLVDHWGKDRLLHRYASWQFSEEEVRLLGPLWQDFKKERFKNKNGMSPTRRPDLPYCKGFNFAHEGYRIYNGYGSALAFQSLEKLQQLGTNMIGLVPYSYMDDPNTPSPIPVIRGFGTENDESTIFSHYHAKALGMASMLKPQIWLGRSWPGDVSFGSDEDWEAFFRYYGRWMAHYALIAEMHQMDMLCVGVEFVRASLQKPDAWRKLIASLREIYSGPITYAANWGAEFEQLSFWEDLDFIGLNCYYPLGKSDKVSKKQLAAAFKEVIRKAEKVSRKAGRPLLLTEIGFRSIQSPWISPHAEANDQAFNEDHQEWCYETVFKTIDNKDWIQGIFWWKWPSYLNYQGRENTSFTPNRKKAEEMVRKYFSKAH